MKEEFGKKKNVCWRATGKENLIKEEATQIVHDISLTHKENGLQGLQVLPQTTVIDQQGVEIRSDQLRRNERRVGRKDFSVRESGVTEAKDM